MTPTYAVDDGFRIPDALWKRIEPLLPKRKPHPRGGRPPLQWRAVLDGIFFVLRTGCQWKAVPRGLFGSASSLHRYFQLLVRRKLFRKLWKMALEEYDALKGIDWQWQAMDAAMTKAPLGGEKDGEKSDRSRQKRDEALRVDRWSRRAAGADRQRCQHARQRVGRSDFGQHPGSPPGAQRGKAAALVPGQGL